RFLFLDRVETAAVDHPNRRRCCLRVLFQFSELTVQPGEVISLADPQDRSKDVKPTHQKIEPLPDGGRHRTSFSVLRSMVMRSSSSVGCISIRAQQERDVISNPAPAEPEW